MSSDDEGPRGRAKNTLGPVGWYVIANLQRIREARKLTYAELAGRLREVGRPIPALGLSRIEKGTRRVDADDLVGLALALGVNPAALLLPRDTDPYAEIELTTDVRATARAAWEWSAGNFPLVASGADPLTWRDIAEFESEARPAWIAGLTEWREDMKRREAEMKELRREYEASEEQLRTERARNGHMEPDPSNDVLE